MIDGNIQYNINREAAQVSALSSGKIKKYEYLSGEKYYHVINNTNRTC